MCVFNEEKDPTDKLLSFPHIGDHCKTLTCEVASKKKIKRRPKARKRTKEQRYK
jgi:hypothetical protein